MVAAPLPPNKKGTPKDPLGPDLHWLFVTAFRKGLKEAGFVEIHLSLSWADAVSHDCTAHAQRFLHSLSRI